MKSLEALYLSMTSRASFLASASSALAFATSNSIFPFYEAQLTFALASLASILESATPEHLDTTSTASALY